MPNLDTNIDPLRLSFLTALISDAIDRTFQGRTFWVIAEVTDHTYKADKNYHFFSLVEKHATTHEVLAKIPASAWGQGSAAIAEFKAKTGQAFTNRLEVLINVSVQYHAAYGLRVSLNEIDPNFTIGALARQREETLRRLVAENPDFIHRTGDTYVTRNKLLNLNCVIQKIAVVCSRTSAGWQDFKHTLDNNPHHYVFSIDVYHTVVQGEANTQQLVDTLIAVFESGRPYDVVVIVRGGGSQTDFLLFNQYLVGKAIARFPIPIITGIGHQRDETIADLMAYQSTNAPTKAAELIVNHNRGFEDALAEAQKQVIIRAQQHFSVGSQRLSQMQSRIVNRSRSRLAYCKDGLHSACHIAVNKSRSILFAQNRQLLSVASTLSAKPRLMVSGKIKDLQQAGSSLTAFVPMYLRNQKGYLRHCVTMINALSPENTLKRGFAVIKVNGAVTSNPDQLLIGEDLEIILASKLISATAKSKKDYDGHDFNI